MQYLRGYQQAYNLDKDIGLFTLYREQAEHENIINNNHSRNNAHLNKSKQNIRNGESTKKIAKRISTLETERSKYVSERAVRESEKIGQNLGELRKMEDSKNKASRMEHEKVFMNRKNISTNRSRNMMTDGTESKQKNKVYFSPRTKIQFQQANNHIKNNLSQNIQSQPNEPSSSKKYLPTIKHHPSIKYKKKTHNSELHNLKLLKSHQYDHLQVKPMLPSPPHAQKQDSPVCSTFVMISSRQYRMLSEKKQVPLLSILKKYSRNT